MDQTDTTDTAPLLTTRGLTKRFGQLVALRDHAIAVRAGEIVGVIGPNGSGKSTFFNLVTGFQRPDAGEVTFAGRRIDRLRAPDVVRAGIARTFQGSRLFRDLTVRDNVLAAAQLRHRTTLLDSWLGTPRLARSEAACAALCGELLDLTALHAQAGRRAGDLPYGDQRRLELARALATLPRLLMLDEPAAGMDATETRSLLTLIDRVRHRFGLAVIVVEHDMDLIMNLCDRVQVLATGETVFMGTPAQVQANPRVREVYLGHG